MMRRAILGGDGAGQPAPHPRPAPHYRQYRPYGIEGTLDPEPGSLGYDLTYETPSRTPTPAGDVLVPFAQAGISGLFGGILGGLGSWGIGLDASPWAIGAGLGAITAAATWAWLLQDQRRTLRTVETLTQRGNPEASPAAPPEQIELKVLTPGAHGNHTLIRNLPTDGATFRTWAAAVTNGRGLAQDAWTGKGGLFSRSQYESILAALLEAGLVRWVNPEAHAQGAELTAAGRATLGKLGKGEL